jgi:hypothetical protein
VTGLAADGSHVYWTLYNTPPDVERAPLDGGAVEIIASGGASSSSWSADSIALGPTRVYWTREYTDAGSFMVSAPVAGVVDGGQAEPIEANSNMLGVSGGNIYWRGPSAAGYATLKAPLDGVPDGGAPTVVTTASYSFIGIDDQSIYGTGFSNDAGVILSIPLTGLQDGGAPAVLATNVNARSATIDNRSVYWVDEMTWQLMGAPLVPDGGTPAVLAQVTYQLFPTGNIVADGRFVYVVLSDPRETNWMLARVPVTGGTVMTLVNRIAPVYLFELVLDSTSLYWTDPSGVWRMVR